MVNLSVRYWRFLRTAATLAAVVLAQSALPAPLAQSTSAEIAATFVSDVTIPDGTVVEPGKGFTKTWRVKNSGSVPWNEYALKFCSGEQMAAPNAVVVPSAAPGAVVDIEVPMVAPPEAGRHEGKWQIHTTDGEELWGGGRVSVLVFVKGRQNLAELETRLRDRSPAVCKKAIDALAVLGPEAVPTLIEIVQTDSDVEVRVYALGLLADTPPLGREAFQAIFKAMSALSVAAGYPYDR